jgi:hypothetical protein
VWSRIIISFIITTHHKEDIMQIKKGDVEIACCDICHNSLKYRRINGRQSYEGHGFKVCSACCADTFLAQDDHQKATVLLQFREKTKNLGIIIPPFWPKDERGAPISLQYIKTILNKHPVVA